MKPKTAEPNEDPDIDPEAIAESVQEEPADPAAPEVDSATAELTEWDTPPSSLGHAAPKVLPEDEASAVETLTREGLEEADRQQRIAAADPDFEP